MSTKIANELSQLVAEGPTTMKEIIEGPTVGSNWVIPSLICIGDNPLPSAAALLAGGGGGSSAFQTLLNEGFACFVDLRSKGQQSNYIKANKGLLDARAIPAPAYVAFDISDAMSNHHYTKTAEFLCTLILIALETDNMVYMHCTDGHTMSNVAAAGLVSLVYNITGIKACAVCSQMHGMRRNGGDGVVSLFNPQQRAFVRDLCASNMQQARILVEQRGLPDSFLHWAGSTTAMVPYAPAEENQNLVASHQNSPPHPQNPQQSEQNQQQSLQRHISPALNVPITLQRYPSNQSGHFNSNNYNDPVADPATFLSHNNATSKLVTGARGLGGAGGSSGGGRSSIDIFGGYNSNESSNSFRPQSAFVASPAQIETASQPNLSRQQPPQTRPQTSESTSNQQPSGEFGSKGRGRVVPPSVAAALEREKEFQPHKALQFKLKQHEADQRKLWEQNSSSGAAPNGYNERSSINNQVPVYRNDAVHEKDFQRHSDFDTYQNRKPVGAGPRVGNDDGFERQDSRSVSMMTNTSGNYGRPAQLRPMQMSTPMEQQPGFAQQSIPQRSSASIPQNRQSTTILLPNIDDIRMLPAANLQGPLPTSNWVIPGRLCFGSTPNPLHTAAFTACVKENFSLFVCLSGPTDHFIHRYRQHQAQIFGTGRSDGSKGVPSIGGADLIEFQLSEGLPVPVSQQSQFMDFCRGVTARVKSGENIYVHCTHGHGPSGIAVSVILSLLYNMPGMRAVNTCDFLHSKRRNTEEQQAPANQQQRMCVISMLNKM